MPNTHYDFLHDPTHNDSYQQTCTSFWHVPTVRAAISLLELVESCCKLGGCGCWYDYIVARYITCRIILCIYCLIPASFQRYCFHTLLSGGRCLYVIIRLGWLAWQMTRLDQMKRIVALHQPCGGNFQEPFFQFHSFFLSVVLGNQYWQKCRVSMCAHQWYEQPTLVKAAHDSACKLEL